MHFVSLCEFIPKNEGRAKRCCSARCYLLLFEEFELNIMKKINMLAN